MAVPLTSRQFDHLMAPAAPFEAAPHLAVAVSGGGDSMALALLADAWARARAGRITALSVDHGLRDGSGRELRRVGAWLAERDIRHVILTWRGPKPASAIQARAREARYRLMEAWCRDRQVLHLLLAHTRDDQAETLLMRLQKGSGPDGLAAMGAIREMRHCRVLRPLLSVPRGQLRGFLRAEGQPWLEDPGNDDTRFARTAARRLLADAGSGFDAPAMSESARRYGMARMALERECDRALAAACRFHEAGFATLDAGALRRVPDEIAVRVVGRVLAAVGGRVHPPKRAPVEGLLDRLIAPGFTTHSLARCLIAPRDGGVLICRERRNMPAPMAFSTSGTIQWDNRFEITSGPRPPGADGHLRLVSVRPDDWSRMVAEFPEMRAKGAVPRAATWGIPGLADDSGIFAVSHLQYRRGGQWPHQGTDTGLGRIVFNPRRAASIAGFCIA